MSGLGKYQGFTETLLAQNWEMLSDFFANAELVVKVPTKTVSRQNPYAAKSTTFAEYRFAGMAGYKKLAFQEGAAAGASLDKTTFRMVITAANLEFSDFTFETFKALCRKPDVNLSLFGQTVAVGDITFDNESGGVVLLLPKVEAGK